MVFSNNLLFAAAAASSGSTPFDPTLIGNSVWLDGSADFLKRTFGSVSNQKRFVLGTWIQRNSISSGTLQTIFATGANGSNGFFFQYQNATSSRDDRINIYNISGGSIDWNIQTSARFRDINYYHILLSYESASSTSTERVQIYINGVLQTSLETASFPSLNFDCDWGAAQSHCIGNNDHNTSAPLPAYLTQTIYLDGKSIQNGDVAVTDFLDAFTYGTNGSQFSPKSDANIAALATTAGGNSFCLDFANSSDLGNDISSNNNDFTPTSMAAANQSVNTPSKVYAAWNPLRNYASGPVTLSEGNLTISGGNGPVLSTKAIPSTGKWVVTAEVSQGDFTLGVATESVGPSKLGTDAKGFCMVDTTVSFLSRTNNSDTNSTSASSAGNKVIAAFDADTGKLWLGRDTGSGYTYLGGGNPATGATPTFTISSTETLYFAAGSAGGTFACDFGQNDFDGTVPSDFQSLNSTTLTAPDFIGADYFSATLYEGNGTGQRVGDFVPFTDAFNVANSAMFEHADVRALKRTAGTPSSSGGKKGTWSTWYKTGVIDTDNIFFDNGTTADNRFSLNMDASGQIIFSHKAVTILKTSADFKGDGAWHNVVLKVDTSLGTAADRAVMFFDGVEITSFEEDRRDNSNFTQNDEIGYMDPGATQFVGSYNGVTANQWDGYLAETIFLDNQFLSADSFGQLDTSTNKWVPKDISGLTLGDQGFYLAYGGNFGTGNGAGDSTGNSNNLTEIGTWSTSDQFIDTPSQNFATIDPVISNGGTPVTVSQGNLQGVRSSSGFQQAYSSFSGFRLQENTGIYFAEIFVGSDTSSFHVGVLSGDPPSSTNRYLGQDSNTYGYDLDGRKVNNGTYTSYGASYTAGDVVGIEIDTGTGSINFHKNGSDQGQAFTGVAGPYNFAFASESGGGPGTFNFGQQMELGGASTTLNATAGGRFKHTPPTGAKALNQDNLDDTSSKITALAWIKNRDAADDNIWMDRVIGTGGYLSTTQNDSGTAATAYGDGGTDVLTTNANAVQRFLQRGVQVGSDENVNTANESYVLWQWLLGDSATTGSSITTGSPSLATTGVVSDANHFSIVQYTGNGNDNATFAHGLGSTPNFVMIKRISGSATNSDWVIHIPGLGTENYIYPHYRIALSSGASSNGMVPDANLVEISTGVATNTNGATHMAYSFKNTPGLCKIGTYTGNSSTNGSYVSTGFRPSWLWIFNTTLTSADAERPIFDTARYKFNGTTTAGGSNGGVNFSDQRAAEEAQNTSLGANPAIDILSDGFKLRANDSTINTGTTYMYICMADIAGNGTLPPVYGR